MKKLAIALMLMLASCNKGPAPGADGYTFGNKQYERQSVQVNIVVYKTTAEFSRELKRRNLPENTVAFTTIRPPFDACTINMIDPSVKYEPEFVGHEFLHCVYGQWHTNNDSRS